MRNFLPRLCFRNGLAILSVSLLVGVLSCAISAQVPTVKEQKKVLVIYAVRREAPAPANLESLLRKTLMEGSDGNLDYYSEYIDLARFPDDAYQKALKQFLALKYKDRGIDLVIGTSAIANDFIARSRSEVFPAAAAVFVGSRIPPSPNSTGVTFTFDFHSTIDFALALQPDTRQVFVISGASDFDAFYLNIAKPQLAPLSQKTEITYLVGLRLPELLQKLANLPGHSIIYYISMAEDGDGYRYVPVDAVDKIAQTANAPIYCWNTVSMDRGVLGGAMFDADRLVPKTSEFALRILRGEQAENIAPIKMDPIVKQVDWRQLQQWGISESKLPPDTLVLNREPTVWQQYKWQIVGFISLLVLETLLIGFLLTSRVRQKRAESERERFASLAEAEHRHLEDVVSNLPGIVWESRLGPDGQTLSEAFVSKQVEKMLGISVEEWMAKPRFWLSIVPEETRDDVLRQRNEILAKGKDGVIQFQWRKKDGQLLWVEGHLSVILDDQNRPVGLRGVTIDITDRKVAESSLRESQERNSAILRAMPDTMFLQNSDGVYLDSHAAEPTSMFASRKSFLGKDMSDVLPAPLVEKFKKSFLKARETTEAQTVEYVLPVNEDDQWFEARVVYAEADRFLSVVRDVTERKRAEDSLRESEARFRMMANTAPVMVWMSGTDKQCTFFNSSWLEFTGRTIDQELGSGWAEGVHSEDYERCLKTYETAFDDRRSFRMEYRLRRADGEYRWIIDEGVPRYTPDGSFAGFIGSCVDFTEQKNAEEALRVALMEVRQLKDELQQENIYLREQVQLDHEFKEIIGNSAEIKYVLFKIQQVATTDSTVLIQGETGTGKELVAQAIHSASARKGRPMIQINCATLPASLIESELFGHEKGAFTGATTKKIGRFEVAHGSTLFLDEIGELPLELQPKLLRVLQQGEFERLGGTQTHKVDVRIIAATNRNLKDEVEKGSFREDLWYRLNVFPITVPPLRDRTTDISMLVNFFVNRFNRKLGRGVQSISPGALSALERYRWPGNVRELSNVVERALINSTGTLLELADKLEADAPVSLTDESKRTFTRLEDVEREHILTILNSCEWRIEGSHGAAQILGLNSSTLRSRMLKLGISRPRQTTAGAAHNS